MEDGKDELNNDKDTILKKAVIDSLKIITAGEMKKFHHNLAEVISNCDDEKELSVIYDMYLVDDDHFQYMYSCIYRSLLEEISKIEPKCNIEPYESISNGISLKKNHIDVHVYCSTSQYNRNIYYKIKNVLEESEQFSFRSSLFSIISYLHLKTGYIVHIDISEPYDLHNSELVNQLKQRNNMINELMLFLKIWFRNMNIYSRTFMTKYCLMTLIIFYLQNTNPPLLLPIKLIQQTAKTKLINGINFALNSQCIPMNTNQNIHQMIKGFFEFYSSLDFEKVIIAPYLGKLINKVDFENGVFKYPEYEAQIRMLGKLSGKAAENLKTNCPICVQDMFYLNRNIANRKMPRFSPESNFEYFKKCISMAQKKFSEPKISIKNLYTSLLVNIIEELEHEFNFDSFSCDIIPTRDELISLAKFEEQPLNLRKLWTKAYIAAIPQIITAVYKINMELQPPPMENCIFKKLEETEELPLPFKWSIRSSIDVWTRRRIPKGDANFMEYELAQTEKLYAERKNEPRFAAEFSGFITITITKDFGSLYIEANSDEPFHKKNNLRLFFGSFICYMNSYNLKHRLHLLESQLQTNI